MYTVNCKFIIWRETDIFRAGILVLVQLKKHSKPRNFVYFAVHVDEICAIKIYFKVFPTRKKSSNLVKCEPRATSKMLLKTETEAFACTSKLIPCVCLNVGLINVLFALTWRLFTKPCWIIYRFSCWAARIPNRKYWNNQFMKFNFNLIYRSLNLYGSELKHLCRS